MKTRPSVPSAATAASWAGNCLMRFKFYCHIFWLISLVITAGAFVRVCVCVCVRVFAFVCVCLCVFVDWRKVFSSEW